MTHLLRCHANILNPQLAFMQTLSQAMSAIDSFERTQLSEFALSTADTILKLDEDDLAEQLSNSSAAAFSFTAIKRHITPQLCGEGSKPGGRLENVIKRLEDENEAVPLADLSEDQTRWLADLAASLAQDGVKSCLLPNKSSFLWRNATLKNSLYDVFERGACIPAGLSNESLSQGNSAYLSTEWFQMDSLCADRTAVSDTTELPSVMMTTLPFPDCDIVRGGQI